MFRAARAHAEPDQVDFLREHERRVQALRNDFRGRTPAAQRPETQEPLDNDADNDGENTNNDGANTNTLTTDEVELVVRNLSITAKELIKRARNKRPSLKLLQRLQMTLQNILFIRWLAVRGRPLPTFTGHEDFKVVCAGFVRYEGIGLIVTDDTKRIIDDYIEYVRPSLVTLCDGEVNTSVCSLYFLP